MKTAFLIDKKIGYKYLELAYWLSNISLNSFRLKTTKAPYKKFNIQLPFIYFFLLLFCTQPFFYATAKFVAKLQSAKFVAKFVVHQS